MNIQLNVFNGSIPDDPGAAHVAVLAVSAIFAIGAKAAQLAMQRKYDTEKKQADLEWLSKLDEDKC